MADGSDHGAQPAPLFVEALIEERRRLQERLAVVEASLAEKGIGAADCPTNLPLPKSSPRDEIERALRTVLSHAAAPMARREVMRAIRHCGVDIRCENPLGSLSRHLARCSFVIRLPDHGYWHRDRVYPQADYTP